MNFKPEQTKRTHIENEENLNIYQIGNTEIGLKGNHRNKLILNR